MIRRFNQFSPWRQRPLDEPQPETRRAMRARERRAMMLGNLLMIAGCYLLVYVGGLYANAAYNRFAARGDSPVPAPAAVTLPPAEVPAAFTVPVLASAGQQTSIQQGNPQAAGVSTVSRVVMPTIGVDSKVVEVGWDIVDDNGQQVAVWQVAEYAVGQHKGSANPGEGGNVVLAGHVGGYGLVFKDLFYIEVGAPITLYSNGSQYRYQVSEKFVVDEEGVPPEQRAANARYIEPTDSEVVTLLTCWPDSGPNRFAQRVIVRAVPFGAPPAELAAVSNWSIR